MGKTGLHPVVSGLFGIVEELTHRIAAGLHFSHHKDHGNAKSKIRRNSKYQI